MPYAKGYSNSTNLISRLVRASLWILAIAFLAPLAHGQSEFSRHEISGQFTTIRFYDATAKRYFLGFGGRYDFNINRRLAFETQVDFFPKDTYPIFQRQGGKVAHVLVGVRAKAVQSQHFSVYGLLRPSVLIFSDVPQYSGPPGTSPGVKLGSQAQFALNLGGGVEYYPTPRLITRFEISGDPTRFANTHETVIICPPCKPRTFPLPGAIGDTWRMSVGVGYRIGRLRENEPEKPVSGKLEFGPQFTTLILRRQTFLDGVRSEPGVGGFASYRIFRFLYADSSLAYFLRDTKSVGVQDGGRIFQGFLGVKGGIRRDHFGLFAKLRPGFQHFPHTLTGYQAAAPGSLNVVPMYGSITAVALDLGGVIEVYLPKRSLLRFDAGDSHPYYPDVRIKFPDGSSVLYRGGAQRHSIQLTVGYGWRF
jgi:hypothetical protein